MTEVNTQDPTGLPSPKFVLLSRENCADQLGVKVGEQYFIVSPISKDEETIQSHFTINPL